jgi:hypothetical protein
MMLSADDRETITDSERNDWGTRVTNHLAPPV